MILAWISHYTENWIENIHFLNISFFYNLLAGILLCRFFSITFTSWSYYLFLKRFYYIQRGRDSVLDCCLPHYYEEVAELLSFLAQLCVPTQLQGLFVHGELEQLHGGLLEGKATPPQILAHMNLVCLVRSVLRAAAVPALFMFLVTLWLFWGSWTWGDAEPWLLLFIAVATERPTLHRTPYGFLKKNVL